MESIADRAALVGAWPCLGLAALGASSAAAFTDSYCGVLISAYSWCGDGCNHGYNFNSATYTGAGDVWVGERLQIAGSTTERAARRCGYNAVDQTFAAYPSPTDADVQDQTGANHTIYGYATA